MSINMTKNMNFLNKELYSNDEFEIISAFFIEYFKKNNRTAKNYAHDYNIFKKYTKNKYGSKTLMKLESAEIADYLDNIECAYDRKIAPSTKERIYDQLHRLYEYFRDRKIIKENPLHSIKKIKSDKKIDEKKLMSYGEADLFIAAVNTLDLREQAMLHLLFTSAPKVSELVALNWNHFFRDQNNVPGFKIKKGYREYYKKVHPDVFELLIEYKISTGRGNRIDASDLSPVFINSNGKRISESWVRKSVYTACELAKIKQYSPSDLRNTNAAFLLGKGVPVAEVSDHMGYSDVYLTARLPIILPNTVDLLHFNVKGNE